MKEDIELIEKMIKEYKQFGDLDNPEFEDTDRIYQAIENLISALHKANKEKHNQKSLRRFDKRKLRKALSDYRQLLKGYKELEEKQKILTHNYQVAINETINKYIVREKIDELENIKLCGGSINQVIIEDKIKLLQELLEERK